ncbi:MAG: DNA-binding response regulator [Actinobacteria bacterium HGW-Actinobacteria-2]|nr:MAG: DNA-binding response regulator [Actinobacteria bacterium HGW-Actinobacteria-2]
MPPTASPNSFTPAPRRVLVVEDEPLIRSLTTSLLENAGFDAMGVGTAADAITALKSFDPDALLVDLDLGEGPGGAEVLAYADRYAPWAALVVMTNAPSPEVAGVDARLIPARAAYLHKRSLANAELVLETLEGVLRDQAPRRDDIAAAGPLSGLSRDQLEVLRLIAAGLSNAEIAARRGTSSHGVEQIVQRLILRLEVEKGSAMNPRVQLAKLYYAHGPSAK